MTSTLITLQVEDEKLRNILERMDAAREEIEKCTFELKTIGYISIKKAASGN